MTDGIGGTDSASTHSLSVVQIQAMARDIQRKNVALEKILSIVGESSPAGRVAKDAMAQARG